LVKYGKVDPNSIKHVRVDDCKVTELRNLMEDWQENKVEHTYDDSNKVEAPVGFIRYSHQQPHGHAHQRRVENKCRDFNNGRCGRGDRCKFKHDTVIPRVQAGKSIPSGVGEGEEKQQQSNNTQKKRQRESNADQGRKREMAK
jgi:hypothetical protein